MSLGRRVVLNSGFRIPQLGFGTWQSGPGEAGISVYEALKVGYRHIDLAKVYGNQAEIGVSLKKAFQEIPNLKREDVFITSKLWNSQHSPELVEPALDDCLEELGLEYLDLYLMHFPVAFVKGSKVNEDLFPLTGENLPDGEVKIDDSVSIVDTWKAMTKLPKSKARSIGVSNFTIQHLETIIGATGVVPAANQIERHPLLRSDDLVAYCKDKNIHITAYSAFGNNSFNLPLLLADPIVKKTTEEVAARTKSAVTPAQVLIAWAQVGGHSVIPKSVTPARIQQNFQEIELTPAEFEQLNSFKTQRRYNIPYIANKPRWSINIFGDEAEKPCKHQVILSR